MLYRNCDKKISAFEEFATKLIMMLMKSKETSADPEGEQRKHLSSFTL